MPFVRGSRVGFARTKFLISGRPETFDPDRLAAARDNVFRDRGNQCYAIETFDDRSKRDLDDDRQDVAKVNGVYGRVEGQLARNIRSERGLDIHEERVADQPCEDPHAIVLPGVLRL